MHSRKPIEPLSKAQFEKKIADGVNQKFAVGNGLYYHKRGGSALWIVQYREGESHRARSLGTYPELSLNEARKRREQFSVERRSTRIPRRGLAVRLTAEPAREPERAAATVKRMRFADVVESFVTLQTSNGEWKTKSFEPRKYRHLKTGALGKLWADEISQTDIEGELQKRWGHVLASADKYRIRIMLVINHAVAKLVRLDGPNPARKEIIKHLIPSAPDSTPHKAMPREDVPAFMAELVADGSNEARALAFLIHTVARTAEARDVDWSEIKGNVWTVPGGNDERSMKERIEHSLPLSPAALALLGKPKKSGRVFGKLPHDALLEKLNELRPDDHFTVHGMRGAFTGWAVKNKYPRDFRKRALAQAIGTDTDQSYDYDPMIEERRPMMVAWSEFLTAR